MKRMLFSLALAFALPLSAQTTTTTTTETQTATPSSYYFLFSGGTGYTKHNDKFSDTESDFRDLGDRRGGTGILEVPGFYLTRGSKTLIGFLPSLYAEDWAYNYLSTTGIALSRFNFDLSYWHFFGGESSRLGVGANYRIDFGHSYIHEFRRINGVEDDYYHNGPNIKASIGYGLEMRGYGFTNFSLGAFSVFAGSVVAQGADITVGFLL